MDLKPELQELVTLMRKTLRTVCDELRRIHKGNKLLEEQHRALAGQLADCEVKRSLQASQAQHSANIASLNQPQSPDVTQSLPKPVTRPLPKKSALAGAKSYVLASSPEAQNDGKDGTQSRKPSERRLTLRLSKNLLRKLSSASGVEVDESDDSGSEIFEANNPEEVLEMQSLLIRLTARHRSENEKRDTQDSVATWRQEDFEEKRVTRHDSVATSRCYEEAPPF